MSLLLVISSYVSLSLAMFCFFFFSSFPLRLGCVSVRNRQVNKQRIPFLPVIEAGMRGKFPCGNKTSASSLKADGLTDNFPCCLFNVVACCFFPFSFQTRSLDRWVGWRTNERRRKVLFIILPEKPRTFLSCIFPSFDDISRHVSLSF
jgi:hypothetical protein